MNQESPPEETKQAPLWHNPLTLLGVFLVVIAVILLMTFGLFSLISPSSNPYLDIIGFLVLPSILVAGLIIAPVGMLLKAWWCVRRDPSYKVRWRRPRLDLADPLQRKVVKIFTIITFFMLPVLGISSYHGYHYTESADFCARACHAVMEPQATTYQRSAHARVSCAECHIGEGAGWFVKSKLSGTRQVFATMLDTYPRPIAPAIMELRPARETCERCHWPEKFYGAQLREIVRYSADEHNTRHEIKMLVKTGGSNKMLDRIEGIHRHMALGNIEYVATDDKFQHIPWVKWIHPDGKIYIYRSDGKSVTDPPPPGRRRIMDCMDCHNRPAHDFLPPVQVVDLYMEIGKIDPQLPFIKREAVAAISKTYPSVEVAKAEIREHISSYYRQTDPVLANQLVPEIEHTIEGVQDAYRNYTFPEMNADWRTYPNNIGHKNFPGCDRCHAGDHVDDHGNAISHDCNICHTFLYPMELEGEQLVSREGQFVHPVELEGIHNQVLCHQCHSGGKTLVNTCQGCHDKTQSLLEGTLVALQQEDAPTNPMLDSVDCLGCHDLSAPATIAFVDAMCMDCHMDEEEKYDGMLESQAKSIHEKQQELDRLLHAVSEVSSVGTKIEIALEDLHNRRSLLEQAGPLHNYEASLSAYEQMIESARSLLPGNVVAQTP